MRARVAVLTVSDRSYLALREDRTGPILAAWVEVRGWELLGQETLPDERDRIAARLRSWADEADADLVLTTGGTGLSPRDVAPEATQDVVDRVVPGLPEWIRGQTSARNPHAVLSRGVAGIRGRTLMVNLPGSPRAVEEYLALLGQVLDHALEQLRQAPNWSDRDRHPMA